MGRKACVSVALLLALLALAPAARPATEEWCDYNDRTKSLNGDGYLYTERSRCHFTIEKLSYTSRVEQVSYLKYDLSQPNGGRNVVTLKLESIEVRTLGGQQLFLNHTLSFQVEDRSIGLVYREQETPNGFALCALGADVRMGAGLTASPRTPNLPACWPEGTLLP